MKTIVGTICYIVKEHRVLLTQRTVAPHIGQWVAPGGRIEFGETPEACIVREIKEETGLVIRKPELRGITSVNDPRLNLHWIAFIYLARQAEGTLLAQPENPLKWFAREELTFPTVPHADIAYFEKCLSPDPNFQAEAHLSDAGDTFHVW
jgi:8-oxo-dGTP diphosphatase